MTTKVYPCGCILKESDCHYCERSQPPVAIPPNLCEHNSNHFDFERNVCGACGLMPLFRPFEVNL